MIKIYKHIFYLIIIFNLLNGCQSIKDGLEGNKKTNNAEEFLIKTKNPLVLPPDYSKLPVPNKSLDEDKLSQEFDLKKLLKKQTTTTEKKSEIIENSSFENSIIKKIKKN